MFKFLINLFGFNRVTEDPMKKFLIVGLGNIGVDYANTRHNIGFKVLDSLARQSDSAFLTTKLADRAVYKLKGRTLILIKPNTFMNLSGKAITYWLAKEKIPIENLLVITDDINLSFGTIRLKTKGSDGGHNGLKDIQQRLNTTKYNRLRFGIGSNFSKGKQVDYVLGKWSEEEQINLIERIKICIEVVNSFALAGVSNTMNQYNGK